MRTQIAVALLLLTATVVEGEEAHLLADLNQDFASATGSTPRFYAALPDAVVFVARSRPDESERQQLWRSDGTPSGTFPLAEICESGNGSNRIESLGVAGEVAFFRFGSCVPDVPSGLWRSDGTAAGTYPLALPGRGNPLALPGGSVETKAVALGGLLYFVSQEPESFRYELWRSDGTVAGTQRVAAFAQIVTPMSDDSLVVAGERLLLVLGNDTQYEVWRSDGTAAGTVLAEDRFSRRGQTYATSGTHLFSIAAQEPFRLFAIDGKSGGVELVWDAPEVSWISSPIPSADGIAFTASFAGGERTQIWSSNGLPGGTVAWTGEFALSQKIRRGSEGAPTLAVLGTRLFFLADRSESEVGLYVTTGSADSVRLVETLPRGAGQPSPWIFALGDKLFFPRSDESGLELWVSDGNPGSSRKLVDACAGDCDGRPSTPVAFGSRLFWTAREVGGTQSLWVTDGSTIGTTRLARGLQRFGCFSSSEESLKLYSAGGRWHFPAKDFLHGCEPWAVREAPDSGALVDDLVVDKPALGSLGPAVSDGRRTVLVARRASPSNGDVVLAIDGEEASEVEFEALAGRCGLFHDNEMTSVVALPLATLFVVDPCSSRLVYGRERGSEEVVQLFGDPRSDRPSVGEVFVAPGNAGLYLTTTYPSELWFTDGTAAGTMVAATTPDLGLFIGWIEHRFLAWDVYSPVGADLLVFDSVSKQFSRIAGPRAASWSPYPFSADSRGRLYFRAQSWVDGETELWRTDGTQEGTHAFYRTGGGETLLATAVLGPGFVFSVRRGDGRVELRWMHDQAALWEVVWSTSEADPWGTAGRGLQALESGLLFSGWDPDHESELWFFSLETRETTRLTATRRGFSRHYVQAGRWISYFYETQDYLPFELWRTDGTAEGTVRLGDWQYASAWDRSLAIVDERLYYTFDDGIHGKEIWTSDGSPSGTRLLADVVPGATGSQPSSFTAANHTLYFLADDGIHGREIWTIPAGHAPPRRR